MTPDPWTKVYESACSDTRLSDRDLRVFIAVRLRTRENGSCWESVAKIGQRAGGKKEKSVQRSLSNLKKHGYLAEVTDHNRRVGRRLVPVPRVEASPSESTPVSVRFDAPPASDLTPNIEHCIRSNEQDQDGSIIPPPPLGRVPLAITLSRDPEGEAAGDPPDDDEVDLVRFRERLRDRLESLARPGDRKHGLVNVVADELSRRLWDEHSKGRYCGMLWDVVKSVTLPGEVLEAFDGALARFARGEAGDQGPYFFGTLDNMRSDRAHEEVEMESRLSRA